jgi:GTP-binding protein
MVELADFRSVSVADIPGLVAGAHRNVGLGHDFLRHIVRCKLLIFVVDIAGSEGRNPIDDLASLRRELDLYDPTLTQRPWIIVANKMDLEGAEENLAALRRRFSGRLVLPVAAAHGAGVDALKSELERLVSQGSPAST